VSEQVERIAATLGPVVESLGLELFDVEFTGSGRARTLRVVIDRDRGVDLDAITEATEAISPVLDGDAALAGSYALEVSSPGVERALRTPVHFRRAVGATVSVKTRSADGSAQRQRGVLIDADDDGITLDSGGDPQRFTYPEVTQARTVFEWGGAARPGKGKKKEAARR